MTNLILARGFSEASVRKMESVAPMVHVVDVSGYMVPGVGFNRRPIVAWEQLVVSSAPRDRERALQKLKSYLGMADILLGAIVASEIRSFMPKLRWLQLTSAGGDYLRGTGLMEGDVIITTASGCAAIPIAEYILNAMLMHGRGAMRAMENRRLRRWERFPATELRGKILGIIGYGSIGKETAHLAKAIGMKVVAIRRSASNHVPISHGVDSLLSPDGLNELLKQSDYVVLTLPLTQETYRLIGETELRSMKLNAYLINVSRGGIIDETALVRALREGWISGAALDVFEKEPLPPDSPLWDIPNLYISPHISAGSERYYERVVDLFCENLGNYLAGRPLLNVFDRQRGY